MNSRICLGKFRKSEAVKSVKVSLDNTVLQKKKVHVPEMRPVYCDRYGPIEKSYVRGLTKSKRVAEI